MSPDPALFGLSQKDLTSITLLLKSYPEVEQALIFGSRALGSYKRGSDIDIALFGNIEDATILAISSQLNEELVLPYFFDVLNYDALTNPELKDHIDRVGVIFYKRDPTSRHSPSAGLPG